MSKKKQRIPREKFIPAWNAAASVAELCKVLGMQPRNAVSSASRLRKEGHDLKFFDPNACSLDAVGHADYQPTNPGKPTRHAPGSIAKAQVLMERASAGEPLWHPGDATCEDCDPAEVRVREEAQLCGAYRKARIATRRKVAKQRLNAPAV